MPCILAWWLDFDDSTLSMLYPLLQLAAAGVSVVSEVSAWQRRGQHRRLFLELQVLNVKAHWLQFCRKCIFLPLQSFCTKKEVKMN